MKGPPANTYWWAEAATGVPQAALPGFVHARLAWPLTLAGWAVFAVILWPVMGIFALPVALIFARLFALDLAAYTLPDIYTLPLAATGLLSAVLNGRAGQGLTMVLLLALLAVVMRLRRPAMGLAEGDLKLLAAMFTFLPFGMACWGVALGCVAWLPVTYARPRHMVPFGVPLIVGWMIILRWPHLPNALLLAIS